MTKKTQKKLPDAAAEPADAGSFFANYGIIVDPELLEIALTHRSWAAEHRGAQHNERLEFLGDSVLGFAIAAKLYADFPNVREEDLSKRRSAVVSTVALAQTARRIGLGKYLKLGRGEILTGGSDKDSILADTVEALIGAVYLSNDTKTAVDFVLQLLAPLLADIDALTEMMDPKTTLQELAVKRDSPPPQYELTSTGPDHNRRYTATVSLLGVTCSGEGTSKKAAELAAARRAVIRLTKLQSDA